MTLRSYLGALGSNKATWNLLFSILILILKALLSHLHNLCRTSLILAETHLYQGNRVSRTPERGITALDVISWTNGYTSHSKLSLNIILCKGRKANIALAFPALTAEANWWIGGFHWSVRLMILASRGPIFKGLKSPICTEIYNSTLESSGGQWALLMEQNYCFLLLTMC